MHGTGEKDGQLADDKKCCQGNKLVRFTDCGTKVYASYHEIAEIKGKLIDRRNRGE